MPKRIPTTFRLFSFSPEVIKPELLQILSSGKCSSCIKAPGILMHLSKKEKNSGIATNGSEL